MRSQMKGRRPGVRRGSTDALATRFLRFDGASQMTGQTLPSNRGV